MTNAKSQATSKRRTAATRFVAALAVAATAGSALVGSQIVAPQAAYAAQEPAATKIDVGDVRAVMGKGVTNNSLTDTSTNYNNEIRYGIVKGMSTDRIRTGNAPLTTYLGGEYAKNNDAWTYIARGMPWKWDDYNPAWGPRDRGTPWRQSHYDQWARAGADKIWVNGQSAIGFKPNNPGQVEPGQTFLLGAIRHNNLPIQGTQQLQPYLHSDLSLQFPGLIDSDPGEAFPLINNETRNTLATTIMYRKGGAYVKTAGEPGTGTCSSSFGINGWEATQKINGKWPRDVVLSGDTYGRPGYTPSGSFIGPAYEPQPIDANDRSKGYVNLPETQSGRIYCVKYVGEGNGEYDLYSQYYNAGAGQPFNTIEGEANLPRTWPGAKGNVNENPYVYDTVKLSKTVSDKTFVKNGRTYRMHLWGFVPATNAHTLITPENITNVPTANCPASPAPDAEVTDTFITQELSVNYACLYGVITEERTVRIAKSVEDPSGVNPTIPAASFGVTTGTTWRDSTGRTPKTTGTISVSKPAPSSAPAKGWYVKPSDSATLTPTGFGEANAKYDSEFIPFEVGNSDFTISENQIADPQWKLKDIKCVNGIGEDVAVTKTERGVNFKNVGGAASNEAAPITCTFVNEYEAPKVPNLRVQKSIENNGGVTGATEFDVDYKIVATNDGNGAGNTGKLTDKPDFAKGLEIQSAKVATTQAGLAGAANATASGGVYTLTNGVNLDPGKTAEFWIRFQVKRNESATGYDVKNLECKLDANGIPTAGYGLFNQVVAESGKDHDGEDNNKACGPVPVTKIRVQKSIEANGGANTGATEFDVDYKIVATNDGNLKTSTGILTDKPEFAKGLEIQSAKVATTQAGLAGAANATAANGTYTLTNGVEVEPGKTAEFWIRFHVKFNSAAAGYDETALECKLDAKGIPTAGFGLFNQVNAQTGKDHDGIDNNKACGPYVPAKVRVEKSIEANGGATGAAEFDVDYKIVATNDGQIATTTGKLTDKPEFAKGLEIQSAKIATTQAGLAGAANATAANGVYTLTNGVTLQPGTTAEFWIRFHVKRNTAASGYSETNLACHLDQKNLPVPGFGLFNQVYAENGKDHDGIDNNKACGPNVPHEIVVVKAGTQNTGKTFTDPTNQYTSGDGSALYPLSGAEFAIYSGGNPQNSTSATLVKTLSAGATTDVYYWSVTGLELNTDYWLVETKAPAGHSLLPRPIPFRLTTDGNGTVVTLGAEVRDQTKWANSAVQAYASVTNATLPQSDQGFVVGGARKATILVKDTEVGHLPVSGSLGIYPYIGVAMALMGGAMVISLVTMKQRRKAENFA